MPIARQWDEGRLCYNMGGKGIDNEVRSDARVLSSGPTQVQPIRGVSQLLTIGGRYLPFTLVLGVHSKSIFHSSPKQSCRWHQLKVVFLQPTFFPPSSKLAHKQGPILATSAPEFALVGVMYKALFFILFKFQFDVLLYFLFPTPCLPFPPS